jgi:hypothetical protein
MSYFNTFSEFRTYSAERVQIRINCCGMMNAKIHRVTFKKMKGYIKQLKNGVLSPELSAELSILEKESEFRQMCLSMKSVFSVELK